MEELYIRAIKGAIMKLKNPRTSEDDRGEVMKSAGRNLSKLKPLNEGMWEDLKGQYIDALPED